MKTVTGIRYFQDFAKNLENITYIYIIPLQIVSDHQPFHLLLNNSHAVEALNQLNFKVLSTIEKKVYYNAI